MQLQSPFSPEDAAKRTRCGDSNLPPSSAPPAQARLSPAASGVIGTRGEGAAERRRTLHQHHTISQPKFANTTYTVSKLANILHIGNVG